MNTIAEEKLTSFKELEQTNFKYVCELGCEITRIILEIYIFKTTKSRTFKFGVCWIKECTDENDVQIWYGASPSI